MSKVICLYGGPGVGKSTLAAQIYVEAKIRGESVELVREAVKELAWNGRRPTSVEQLCFLTEHIRRESALLGKVDTIITDAPVALVAFYTGLADFVFSHAANALTRAYLCWAEGQGHTFDHRLVTRAHPYDAAGRMAQTEAEEIGRALPMYLRGLGLL